MAQSRHFMLVLGLLVCSICGFAESKIQQLEYFLRTVGHEFLLQVGDRTSRVLPIEKIGKTYTISFADSFAFEPDVLIYTVDKVMKAQAFNDSFYVEVELCDLGTVVHSFQVKPSVQQTIVPCRERGLPKRCYYFHFTPLGNDSSNVKSDPMGTIYLLGGLVLLTVVVLIMYQKRLGTSANGVAIGKYIFDKERMMLKLKTQTYELSGKEADLLDFLYSNKNKTLTRDQILNKVWGDEGSYIGRTLDVFISKLRKKLESDANLKILNVRGVGYRFVEME